MDDHDFPFLIKYEQLGRDLRDVVKEYVEKDSLINIRSYTSSGQLPRQIQNLVNSFHGVGYPEIQAMWVWYASKLILPPNEAPIAVNSILRTGEYNSILTKLRAESKKEQKQIGVVDKFEKLYAEASKKIRTQPTYSDLAIESGVNYALFNDMTPVELFESSKTSVNIPVILLKWRGGVVIKLNDTVPYDSRWGDAVTEVVDNSDDKEYEGGLYVAFVINNVSDFSRYSSRAKNISVGVVYKNAISSNFSVEGDKMFTFKYKFITLFGMTNEKIHDCIIQSFPKMQNKRFVLETITGKCNFTDVNFSKPAFADIVFCNPIVSKILFFEESANSAVSKERFHMYLFKNFGTEYNAKNGIMTTMIPAFGKVEVRMKKVENLDVFERYITTLQKVFCVYLYLQPDAEKWYSQKLGKSINDYLEGNASSSSEKINIKEGKRLAVMKAVMSGNVGRMYDDLFKSSGVKDWSRTCAVAKQPYIVTPDRKAEFEQAKKEYISQLREAGYSRDEIKENVEHLSMEWNGYNFACIPRTEKEKKHTHIRLLKTGEPCCASATTAMKEKPQTQTHNPAPINMDKPLDFGRMGLYKPFALNRLLKVSGQHPDIYYRYNLGNATDSFMRCILFATQINQDGGLEMKAYDSAETIEYMSQQKADIGIPDDAVVSPDIYISDFSDRYDVNICIFNVDDKKNFGIYTPSSAPEFDEEKGIVVILYNIGNGLCELVVKHVDTQTTGIIPKGEGLWKNLRTIFKYGYKKFSIMPV
jgi:hypothetical protein